MSSVGGQYGSYLLSFFPPSARPSCRVRRICSADHCGYPCCLPVGGWAPGLGFGVAALCVCLDMSKYQGRRADLCDLGLAGLVGCTGRCLVGGEFVRSLLTVFY